jgi:elongation factor P--beta-lysine ligase
MSTSDKPAGIEFYGGYQVYSESGVDLTLLRERLKLTVTERWEQNFQALELVEAFREAGRAKRARDLATADRSQR